MVGLKQILVPFDYSPPADAALALAATLAAAFKARLVVLHFSSSDILEDYVRASRIGS